MIERIIDWLDDNLETVLVVGWALAVLVAAALCAGAILLAGR